MVTGKIEPCITVRKTYLAACRQSFRIVPFATVSLKHGLRTADCGLRTADCGLRTADCGPGIKHGLGIKRGLNRKCGPILKIAERNHCKFKVRT